jgi:hypothetical protein
MRRVTYTKEFREEACRLVSEQHLELPLEKRTVCV